MNIRIVGVRDAGIFPRERVVLKATRETRLGDYLVGQGQQHWDGGVLDNIAPLFWFPDTVLRRGDLVVLYSKDGQQKQKTNKDSSTSHFYYLGKDRPIWVGRDRVVILAEIDTWERFDVPADEEATHEPTA